MKLFAAAILACAAAATELNRGDYDYKPSSYHEDDDYHQSRYRHSYRPDAPKVPSAPEAPKQQAKRGEAPEKPDGPKKPEQ